MLTKAQLSNVILAYYVCQMVFRFLVGTQTLIDYVNVLRTSAFGSFELFYKLRLMCVSVPSQHTESTNSLIVSICVLKFLIGSVYQYLGDASLFKG